VRQTAGVRERRGREGDSCESEAVFKGRERGGEGRIEDAHVCVREREREREQRKERREVKKRE
jgi:hypothetical protein